MNIGIVTTYDEITMAFFQALFLKLFLEEEVILLLLLIQRKKYNCGKETGLWRAKSLYLVQVMQKIWKFKSAKSTYLNEIKVNSKESII